MRGKTHSMLLQFRLRSVARLCGAMVVALSLAGCSTVNLTGFDFPVFGILKKSDKDARETVGSADASPVAQKLSTL